MTGNYDREAIAALRDKSGISIQQAFREFGLNFDRIDACRRPAGTFQVFIELHIEQGPILESENKRIGLVRAIASPTRLRIDVKGEAAHTGTTPMHCRKDALAAASEIILSVERLAVSQKDQGTVATVGGCEVKPGLMNVVPEHVQLLVDIRGTSMSSKLYVVEQLQHIMRALERERGVTVQSRLLGSETPVALDPDVFTKMTETCSRLRLPYLIMNSGAGHDAMNMAHICPTGLIFVPSRNGVSHHPSEHSSIADIGLGALLLEEELVRWAKPCTADRRMFGK